MAIDVPKRRPANEPVWISDRRLYLDAQGRVVEQKDPHKLTLLVPMGGSLPMAEARRLGLVDVAPPLAATVTAEAVLKAVAVMQQAGEPDVIVHHHDFAGIAEPVKAGQARKPQPRGAKRK